MTHQRGYTLARGISRRRTPCSEQGQVNAEREVFGMHERNDVGLSTTLDVPYGPDPLQCLDVYAPNGASRAPLILFVHGGGWAVGDKAQYAAVGVAGPSRIRRRHRELPALAASPASCTHGRRGTSGRLVLPSGPLLWSGPRAIYAIGHSSGAHLAALVALDPSYLAAEVSSRRSFDASWESQGSATT